VGQDADIVVLDAAGPAMAGRTDDIALDTWIFAAGPVVRHVVAGGRHVVREGRHVAADAIGARYAATVRRLLQAG
jgi:formimidoylglutamate deiminase